MLLFAATIALALMAWCEKSGTPDSLESGFRNPPPEARLRCYWWWLNGNTDEQTITRDLEAMKANGYGGVNLVDANGADQGGNDPVPAGPTFGSAEWRVLFRHALKEADRLGLVITLNAQSGWNLGGPTVQPKDAAKIITWSRISVEGPARIHQTLPDPARETGFLSRHRRAGTAAASWSATPRRTGQFPPCHPTAPHQNRVEGIRRVCSQSCSTPHQQRRTTGR